MALNFSNLQMATLRYGSLTINTVMKGANTIWTAISSCFGGGFWNNQAPWANDEGWSNGK
jgi:hypothetical protein